MTASSNVSGTIRIGTRGSRLARWQAEWVSARLMELEPSLRVELIEIKTLGDRDRNSPLSAIGGMGLFTKEIQRAVLDGTVDVAVHSLKDLPTQKIDNLLLAAVPAREDVADALIAPRYQTIKGLRQGARIGTSSPRRRAQLLFLRPDLEVVSLRGNVETRLNQALEGPLDAIILACAGLHRLGLAEHITDRLDPLEFLPAVGQGALGIECRSDDLVTTALLTQLDDSTTRRAVVVERSALATLEGGCTLPMAAWARDSVDGGDASGTGSLAVNAAVFDPDGCARVAVMIHGPHNDPEGLGRRAAHALLDQGASPLLRSRVDS
jgi:hydroxymethylbilane synthase